MYIYICMEREIHNILYTNIYIYMYIHIYICIYIYTYTYCELGSPEPVETRPLKGNP